MSRRSKILIGAGIVLGLAILIPVVHHYQLRFAVENYIVELKAKGEPMELAQVLPPPVPPEQNAAPLITNELAQIYLERNWTNAIFWNNPPEAMNRTVPGKEIIGWHQAVIHAPDTWPRNLTNTWAELRVQLAERQNELNGFRKLVENPAFNFGYDYSSPKMYVTVPAPHLSQIKMAIQWLEASEFYNLHWNKTADACADVRAMLAFVEGQTRERFEISQVVRFAFARMIADATWNILQTTNVSDENLAQLQQDWKSQEFIAPLKNAFLFERVSDLRQQNDLRRSATNLVVQVAWMQGIMTIRNDGTYALDDKRSIFQRVKNGIAGEWDKLQWRYFWSFSDEIRGLRMWRAVIDGTQLLETNGSYLSVQSFVETNFARLGFDFVKSDPFEIISQNAHGQTGAIRHAARAEVTKNVVISAIAIKRYELKHHQLPDSLSELVPDFLKAVPTDYMNGQPLHYRRNDDGTFVLYSVGCNGKDDGGSPALEKTEETSNSSSNYYDWQQDNALDWVWPQPATEAEIQNYYEHPPK